MAAPKEQHELGYLYWRFGGPVYGGQVKETSHVCFRALQAPRSTADMIQFKGTVLIDQLGFHIPDNDACVQWYEYLKATPILQWVGDMDSDGWVDINPNQPAFLFLNSLEWLRPPIKCKHFREWVDRHGPEQTLLRLIKGEIRPSYYWHVGKGRMSYLSSLLSGELFDAVCKIWPEEGEPYSTRGKYGVVTSDWYDWENFPALGVETCEGDVLDVVLSGKYPNSRFMESMDQLRKAKERQRAIRGAAA